MISMVNTIWLSGQKGLKYYRKMEACQQISDFPSTNGIENDQSDPRFTVRRSRPTMSMMERQLRVAKSEISMDSIFRWCANLGCIPGKTQIYGSFDPIMGKILTIITGS